MSQRVIDLIPPYEIAKARHARLGQQVPRPQVARDEFRHRERLDGLVECHAALLIARRTTGESSCYMPKTRNSPATAFLFGPARQAEAARCRTEDQDIHAL